MKFFSKKNNRTNGFTLVETLVAISIFTFSILGLMSVLTTSISNTYYAKQKMIAAYLAQEGIEYIRNMRDTIVLYNATSSQLGWEAFRAKLSSASCDGTNGCYFNDQNLNFANHSQQMALVDTLFACQTNCPQLKYEVSSGKYGYASGADSGFVRRIAMSPRGLDETIICSAVFWTQGSGDHKIEFCESLFNWIE